MTDAELLALLQDIESDRVERKATLTAGGTKEKIAQAICAFANDLPNHRLPGVIFVGANDDGSCANLSITDQLLLNLAEMKQNGNIYPFPSMLVQKKTLHGCDVAVIEVQPSDSPPVRYNGVTWIRVGPRRAIATQEDERRLSEKRRAGTLPFDVRPIPTATKDDLDLTLFRTMYLPLLIAPDILEENQRSIEQQLASVRMATPDNPPIPTVLGIISIGIDPLRYLPNAYVQFIRFDGETLDSAIKDQKSISGPLPEVLRVLIETLQINISVATDLTSTVEVKTPDYPFEALRQIALNALLHRNYEGTNAPVRISWFADRIEILSPGGTYGQVNLHNFGEPGITDYRNPNLAEIMRALGYVQRFGVGIARARAALVANGNPPLEFEIQPSTVLSIIRKRS